MNITVDDIGKIVFVKAKSQKGLNRIHENGHKWKIKKVWTRAVLLEGTTDLPKYKRGLRWVETNGTDVDFEITGIEGE